MSSLLSFVEADLRRAWVEDELRPALWAEEDKTWLPGIKESGLIEAEVHPAAALLEVTIALYLNGECDREQVRIAARRVADSWWVARARCWVEVLGNPRGRGVERYMKERRAELEGTEPTA